MGTYIVVNSQKCHLNVFVYFSEGEDNHRCREAVCIGYSVTAVEGRGAQGADILTDDEDD